MANNVSDILKQLDSLNESNGISIFVPSLKRAVRFKSLNLKQQKDLLKSSIDDSITKLSFSTKFYSIIQENAIDLIDVSKLYTFDRLAIALSLRSSGLSSTYNTNNGQVELSKFIDHVQTVSVDPNVLKSSADVQNLTINLEAPTLGVDRDVSLTTASKLKGNSDKDVKTLIGELFVHEIVKFIQSITFKTESGDQTAAFTELKVDDRIAITEKLPSIATNKILDFIKTYRAFENTFVTADGVTIDIDSSFFSV